jgi:hypothetical protein
MANLVACEHAEELPDPEIVDLFGVTHTFAPDFAVWFLLEPADLKVAREHGIALLADGQLSEEAVWRPARLLLYDHVSGSGAVPRSRAIPLRDVPEGRWELELVAGAHVLARVSIEVRK